MTAAAFAHDAFLIERARGGEARGADACRYRVRPLTADGLPGEPIAVAGASPPGGPAGGGREVLRIHLRRTAEVGSRYDVTGPDGERVGVLEHRTRPTLVRASWALLDSADEHLVAWAREHGMRTALTRRLRDRLAPRRPSRTDGRFTLLSGQRPIGEIGPTGAGGRDRVVDLRGDRERRVDRRAAVALGVAIDVLGRR